jgi:hypothetical protein
MDTPTYKEKMNISRNMHKARSSQLLPPKTDIEETHEELSAVQVFTTSKEQLLLVNDSKKKFCNVPACRFRLGERWWRKYTLWDSASITERKTLR